MGDSPQIVEIRACFFFFVKEKPRKFVLGIDADANLPCHTNTFLQTPHVDRKAAPRRHRSNRRIRCCARSSDRKKQKHKKSKVPWRHCIFTDTGVVFPPPLKTQPSRPCGSGSGPHLKDKPSRDILESLEQMELIAATASAATTPIAAPDSPAASPLPCAVEHAPLPAKLANGWLQRDEQIAIFEKPPSFKLRLGWPRPPLETQPSLPVGSGTGAHLKNKPSRDILESL